MSGLKSSRVTMVLAGLSALLVASVRHVNN